MIRATQVRAQHRWSEAPADTSCSISTVVIGGGWR